MIPMSMSISAVRDRARNGAESVFSFALQALFAFLSEVALAPAAAALVVVEWRWFFWAIKYSSLIACMNQKGILR